MAGSTLSIQEQLDALQIKDEEEYDIITEEDKKVPKTEETQDTKDTGVDGKKIESSSLELPSNTRRAKKLQEEPEVKQVKQDKKALSKAKSKAKKKVKKEQERLRKETKNAIHNPAVIAGMTYIRKPPAEKTIQQQLLEQKQGDEHEQKQKIFDELCKRLQRGLLLSDAKSRKKLINDLRPDTKLIRNLPAAEEKEAERDQIDDDMEKEFLLPRIEWPSSDQLVPKLFITDIKAYYESMSLQSNDNCKYKSLVSFVSQGNTYKFGLDAKELLDSDHQLVDEILISFPVLSVLANIDPSNGRVTRLGQIMTDTSSCMVSRMLRIPVLHDDIKFLSCIPLIEPYYKSETIQLLKSSFGSFLYMFMSQTSRLKTEEKKDTTRLVLKSAISKQLDQFYDSSMLTMDSVIIFLRLLTTYQALYKTRSIPFQMEPLLLCEVKTDDLHKKSFSIAELTGTKKTKTKRKKKDQEEETPGSDGGKEDEEEEEEEEAISKKTIKNRNKGKRKKWNKAKHRADEAEEEEERQKQTEKEKEKETVLEHETKIKKKSQENKDMIAIQQRKDQVVKDAKSWINAMWFDDALPSTETPLELALDPIFFAEPYMLLRDVEYVPISVALLMKHFQSYDKLMPCIRAVLQKQQEEKDAQLDTNKKCQQLWGEIQKQHPEQEMFRQLLVRTLLFGATMKVIYPYGLAEADSSLKWLMLLEKSSLVPFKKSLIHYQTDAVKADKIFTSPLINVSIALLSVTDRKKLKSVAQSIVDSLKPKVIPAQSPEKQVEEGDENELDFKLLMRLCFHLFHQPEQVASSLLSFMN